MKRFLSKLAVFLGPFLVLAGLFLTLDPFRILYRYADYGRGCFVTLNYDFVSTEKYRSQRSQYHYDSFIFGTSRVLAFKTRDWETSLAPGSRPFCFGAWRESLYGIWRKVRFIDQQRDPIRNALVVICPDMTLGRTNNSPDYLYTKHPALSGESRLRFDFKFLRTWMSHWFFLRYLDYAAFQTERPWLKDYLETRQMSFDPITNDVGLGKMDAELRNDPDGYFRRHHALFYARPSLPGESAPVIGPVQLQMLRDIQEVFRRHQTRYRIVISPLYDQIALNRTDLRALQDTFGTETVYDFSGVNAITTDAHNYYEPYHYRPDAARRMLAQVYSPSRP